MAEAVQEIKGLSELLRALDELPVQMERNIVRAALRDGIRPIAVQVANELVRRTRTGRLAKSMRLRSRTVSGEPKVVVSIGNKDAYYAHMVERGTKPHEIKPRKAKSLFIAGKLGKLVKHPGARPAFILKTAYEQNAEASVRIFRDQIKARISAEWNRLARKGLIA